MNKISLNKAIALIFGKVENVKRRKVYSNIGKEYHLYFTVTDTKQMYNLYYNTIAFCNYKKVMYRKVSSYDDTIGEFNCWDFERKLNDLGYYL